MKNNHLISADEFCTHYQIEASFIHCLHDYDLIKITTIEGTNFIDADDLNEVESLIRLHYELHINLEGIDAVKNLVHQVQQMQKEMAALKNKLRLYNAI
jgi:hypothetical protein